MPEPAPHPAVAHILAAHKAAEQHARDAAKDSGGENWTDGGPHGEDVHVQDSSSYVATGAYGCSLDNGVRLHVALHDPAAVLRRIAAEQEMLTEHARTDEDICQICMIRIGSRWDCAPWPCTVWIGIARAWGWTG